MQDKGDHQRQHLFHSRTFPLCPEDSTTILRTALNVSPLAKLAWKGTCMVVRFFSAWKNLCNFLFKMSCIRGQTGRKPLSNIKFNASYQDLGSLHPALTLMDLETKFFLCCFATACFVVCPSR